MKIGFLLSNIKTSDGGIYQYSIYIFKMLLKCDEIEQIVAFVSADQQKEFSSLLNHPKVTLVKQSDGGFVTRFVKKVSDFYLTRYYLKGMTRKMPLRIHKLLNPDRHFFNRFNIDLLHVPRQHSPAYLLKYPVVVSMHDVQHLHFPEFFTPVERIYKSVSYYNSLNETDHVVASYQHVKNDLIKYFRIEADKVNVCPVPLDEDWVADEQGTSPEVLKAKYNIPDAIMLTPAATWEHKNHMVVLEAMALLKSRGIKLFWVATGNKTKFYPVIEERIKQLGLEDLVLFTGIVPHLDLKGLYTMAKLVVIPTMYEAGSGPLVEAMRYLTPVICSNVTSLPDTIGNSAFTFSPGDTERVAELISKVLGDPEFVKSNKANSQARIDYYSQLSYSDAFLAAYRAAVIRHTPHT